MTKPKAIEWLEQETGQTIEYLPEIPRTQERHLSVRLSADLAERLGALAADRGMSISLLVRELLTDAVLQREEIAALDARALGDRLAADVAEVRRRLTG